MFTIPKKTFNDFHIGLCFLVLFAASDSLSHIQQMFFVSINHDNPLYDVNGYVTLGIRYTCASLAVFIAPSVTTMIGCKWTMLIGAITYIHFVLYYFESSWLAYLGMVLNGFGEGFLWLGRGTYLILNSEVKSTTQSVGIFYAFYRISFFISNAVIFLFFNGNDDPYLNQSTRRQMIIILASVVIGAIIMFSLLRNPIRQNQVDELHLTSLGELKDIGRTMISKDTLPDNFIYILAGFHITFVNVMRSSFGFTEYLSDNSKILIPLSGVTQNIGDIIGTLLIYCVVRKEVNFETSKFRIIPIACIVTTVTSIMVFLALPNSSAFTYTDQKPMIEFSIYFIMMGNVLVGFGGQCLHIEIMNYLGYMHPHKCAPSLVHKEFMQNVGMAISFYYSSYLGLQIQSAIFMLFSILAACAFYGSWNKSYLPDDGKNAKSKKYTVNKMGSV